MKNSSLTLSRSLLASRSVGPKLNAIAIEMPTLRVEWRMRAYPRGYMYTRAYVITGLAG